MKKIFMILLCGVLTLSLTGCNGVSDAEGSWAEKKALEKISEKAFDTPKSSELECKAKSKESDGIILVECTTSHEQLIEYYEAKTIWFGYLESADGKSYYYYSDKSKDKVLEMIRK